MLEIKPVCEHCGRELPNDSGEAMICTFECTFCRECVENILFNVCPNCGGGFERRPTRPSALLRKHPVQTKAHVKPVDGAEFQSVLAKFKDVPPRQR